MGKQLPFPRHMKALKHLLDLVFSQLNREIAVLLFAIVLLIAFGTTGFMLIEGWDLLDSVYMTVTTVATVGFGEVHQLSDAGRVFTILLIILGVGLFAFVLTTLSSKIIQKQLVWVLRHRKMNDAIDKLEKHTIICGYGRLSRIAAKALQEAKHPFVIVDKDEGRVSEARDSGYLAMNGDATLDETLLSAGVKRAERLVCLMPKDADNLYVILTSRELSPNLFILSRAEDDAGEKRLQRAGANRIVAPYRVGGQKIVDGLLRPYVTDFIDLAAPSSGVDLQIEQIRVPSQSPLASKSLKDSGLRQKTNVIIAAIISQNGEMHFNPSGDTMIEAGVTLIGMGSKRDFVELEKMVIGAA